MTFEEKVTVILNDNKFNNKLILKLIMQAYFDEWTVKSKEITNKMLVIRIDENECIQI